MIVRILGEGQYRLDDAAAARANVIDQRVQAATEANDETAFAAALAELVALIVESGTPLAPEEFIGSDAVVPARDTTLDQARDLLSYEGLIPD